MGTEAEIREARRQRILARGSDRLASITGEKVVHKPEAESSTGVEAVSFSGAGDDETRKAERGALSGSGASDAWPESSEQIQRVADILKTVQGNAEEGKSRLAESTTLVTGDRSKARSLSGALRESCLLTRFTPQVLSALEAAAKATEGVRVCCAILLALCLIFVHHVRTCTDSTLTGTSPGLQPMLLLAILNSTVVLGWCILSQSADSTEGAGAGQSDTSDQANGVLLWLGRVDLAARMFNLGSVLVSNVLRDGSFFLISFGLLWMLHQQYVHPSFCLSRSGIPT